MKKFFSLVLMTLILGLSAFAQSDYAYTAEITIGDPSSTITSSSIPVNDFYKYSASRSLYFPGELQVTGDITDISYYFAYSSATQSMALSIYMGIVDRTSFSGAADLVPMDSLTLVWSGNKSFQPNSWNTITLDTPFNYDGTGALVIAVLNTTGAYDGSGRIFKMTPAASATRATAHYQDGTPAPANVATAFGSSATSTSSPILKVTFGSDQPFCAAPSFDISEVTSSSFDITITDEETSSYLVRYKSYADEDWIEMPLNDITATISDLTSNTLYTVEIAKLCDDGEYTPYATQTVRTDCGIMNIPYEEGFESYATDAIPPCYDAHYGVSGYPQVYSSTTYAHGGSKCINFHSVANPNTSSTLILPQFEEDINTLRVKYWTRREGASSGRLEIGVISDPTDLSTFIVVDSVSAANTDNTYAGYITSFDGLEVDDPSAYRIAFRYVASRATNYYWYLDDVTVEEIPDCSEPTSLAVADIQANSAELSWAGSEDISYTVYYKPTNSQEAYEEISGVNSPYLLEDLEANTAYTWYVATECADEPRASLSTSHFRTACALIEELPVVFDMEEIGDGTNPVPVCWIRGNGSTTYPYSYSSYAISGSRSLYFYYKNTIALPAINLDTYPINTLQVTLKTRYSSQYNFSVGVMTDPTDTNTFEPVSTFEFGGSVDSVTVSLAGYEGEGTYIAFRNEPTGTNTYTYAYVDDVVLEEIPDCGPVYGLAVENATAESITLSWADEDKEYDVYMRVSEEDGYELVASSATTPAEISSLEELTTYQFMLMPTCSDDETLARTITATTTMIPVELPYETDFEEGSDVAWQFDNGTAVNTWHIAQPTEWTSNAMFVGQTETSAAYSKTSPSVVTATKVFDAGEFEKLHVDFDVKVGGESSYDYLKVFLAPASESYPSSNTTSYPTYSSNDYTTNAMRFDQNASYPYIMNLTSGSTVHISRDMVNPNVGGLVKLVFMWKNDNTSGTTPAAILDNISVSGVVCPTPANITASNIEQTSATISWTGDAESYTVYYKSALATEWSEVEVYDTIADLVDLTHTTTYAVKVIANCGGEDLSNESVTISFTTACGIIDQVPMMFDMETTNGASSNAIPVCWTRGNGSTTYPYISTSYAISGTHSLYFYTSSTSRNTIALPQIDVETLPLNTLQLTANTTYTTQHKLSVGVMTDPTDTTTFVEIASQLFGGDIHSITVPFSSYEGEGTYIALRADYNTDNYAYVYLDDVVLETIPDCGPIVGLAVADVTDASVTLSWTDEREFDVYYRVAGEEDWTLALSSVETPAEVADLEASTAYQFKLMPTCTEDEYYARTIAATTLCAPIEELPWSEDFESAVALPLCWTVTNTSNIIVADASSTTYVAPQTGSNYLRWKYSTDGFAFTPTFALTAGTPYVFKFNYRADNNSGWSNIYAAPFVGQNANAMVEGFEPEVIASYSSTSYTEYELNFTPEEDGEYSFGIHVAGNGTPWYFAVDNVSLEENNATCFAPLKSSVQVTATSTTAMVSFTDLNEDNISWNLYYKAEEDEEWSMETISDTVYELTDLTPTTTYQLYVRTDCGGEESDSTYAVTFTTLCAPIEELPWSEDFESAEALPSCWTVTNESNIIVSSSTSYVAPQTGTNYLRWKYSTDGFAFTPTFALTAGTPYVFKFNYRADNYTGWSNIYAAPFVGQNANAMVEGFEPEVIASYSSTSYAEYELNFTPEEDGEYSFGIHVAGDGTPWYFAVDNVSLEENNATCFAPVKNSVQITTTATTAMVSFTDLNEDNISWNLYYKSEDDEDWTIETINATEYELTGLTPSTTYQVYVRTNCGEGDESDSTYAVTFTTDCETFTDFPYVMNFDNGVDCWTSQLVSGSTHWGISSSQSVSGTRSAHFTYDPESSARLISPVFDITSLQNPTLAYAYFTNPWYGDADSIDVYYRTSAEDEWVFLAGYSDGSMTGFAFDTIALPNASAEYQVMFLGIGMDGNGVYLDDVTIFDAENGGDDPCTPTTSTLTATICEGETYTFNGQTLTTAGTYTATLTNAAGCDSTVTLTLAVNPVYNVTVSQNIIEGNSYTFNGQTLTTAGTYTANLQTINGCDSVVTLILTVSSATDPCTPTSSTVEATICAGETYTFNGQTLTTAGTYTATLLNAAGCDSTVTLTLTVNAASTSSIEATICAGETYTFNGQSLTTAGTYTATLLNAAGCDSTVTLTLTVNAASTSSIEASICSGETYTFNGQTLTTAGTYTATLQNANGCDSVVTLTLTVNVAENTQDSVSINAGETYEWNGETYSQAGTYTAEMTDENGCSYTATLVLTVNNGLTDAENLVNVTLYPNPTTSNATLNVEGVNEEAMVIVTDIQGRTIQSNKLAAGQTTMTISTESLASGVYYVRVITANATRTEKLIKK